MGWIDIFIKKLYPIFRKDLDIESAYILKYKNLPYSLFKYREVNKFSINNLLNDSVWLSNPTDFNDPYDSSFTYDFTSYGIKSLNKNIDDFLLHHNAAEFTKQEIKRIKDSEDSFQEMNLVIRENATSEEKIILDKIEKVLLVKMQKELYQDFNLQIKSSFRICSFSTINTSLLMWSHYAKNHTGFCIEYDTGSLKYNSLQRQLYPIIYTDNLFNTTKYQNIDLPDRNNLHLMLSALYKSIEWKYEKEWRLIIHGGINIENHIMPRPKAIYLGSQINNDNKLKLIKIATYKNIPIFQMELDSTKFRLNIKTIKENNTLLDNKSEERNE